jgi:low temperature requirement protein LtrA
VLARSADPGRLGRVAYTYFHLPMVAGIIVTAVGDDLTITDPGGDADAAATATVLGDPALFLAGMCCSSGRCWACCRSPA